MVTHLFHARGTNVITGARGIHTYCGEVVTEDSPDYAALRDYEPDNTANFLQPSSTTYLTCVKRAAGAFYRRRHTTLNRTTA